MRSSGSPPASMGRTAALGLPRVMRWWMVSGRAVRQNTVPLSSKTWRVSSWAKAPPPAEITLLPPSHKLNVAWRSMARNTASPSSLKIRWIGLRARRTISSSMSAARRPVRRAMRRPTWLLPVAMKPTRMMLSADMWDSGFRRKPE